MLRKFFLKSSADYYKSITNTIKISITKFLDTKLNCINDTYKTIVQKEYNKLKVPEH